MNNKAYIGRNTMIKEILRSGCPYEASPLSGKDIYKPHKYEKYGIWISGACEYWVWLEKEINNLHNSEIEKLYIMILRSTLKYCTTIGAEASNFN